MPDLQQFEELFSRFFKDHERRQSRLSNIQTICSLIAGWLLSAIASPQAVFSALHIR